MSFNFDFLFRLILLFFTAVGMHIMTFMPVGSGLYIISNIIGWAVVGILIGITFWHISKVGKIVYSKLIFFIIIGATLLFFPAIFQEQTLVNLLPRLLAVLGMLFYLVALYQTENNYKRDYILYIFLVGIAIEATIGIFQLCYFNLFDVSNSFYQLLNGRPSGTFRQPNVMASFMATGIALSIFLIARLDSINKWKTYLCLYTLCASTLLIVILQSRAGYLGTLIVLLMLIPLFKVKFSVLKRATVLMSLSAVIGLIVINSGQSTSRGTGVYTDGGIRKEIYQISTELAGDNILKGAGYGTFEKEFRKRLVKSNVSKEEMANIENLDHPHNEILYWAVEGGIVALFGLLVFAFGFFYMFNWRLKLEHLAFISLLTPLLIHSQLEFPFYISMVHFLLFVTLIWFIDSESAKLHEYKVKLPNLYKTVGSLGAIFLLAFMLTGLHTALSVNKMIDEKNTSFEKLNALTNQMIWQSYVHTINLNLLYKIAIKTGDIDLLKYFINSSQQEMENKPRATTYDKMIKAIIKVESLGGSIELDKKKNIFVTAKELYPYIFTYQISN